MDILDIIGIWLLCIFLKFDLYYLSLGLIVFFILRFVFKRFHQKEEPSMHHFGSVGQIRKYLHQQRKDRYYTNFLIPGPQGYTQWERDVDVLIAFDKQLSSGERTALPKLHTQYAKDLFSEYLRLLEKERTNSLTTDEKAQIIDRGGWRCHRGRYNLSYTDTCVCGKNKRSIPPEFRKKILPAQKTWLCPCGRENQYYASTCVCGTNKWDVDYK